MQKNYIYFSIILVILLFGISIVLQLTLLNANFEEDESRLMSYASGSWLNERDKPWHEIGHIMVLPMYWNPLGDLCDQSRGSINISAWFIVNKVVKSFLWISTHASKCPLALQEDRCLGTKRVGYRAQRVEISPWSPLLRFTLFLPLGLEASKCLINFTFLDPFVFASFESQNWVPFSFVDTPFTFSLGLTLSMVAITCLRLSNLRWINSFVSLQSYSWCVMLYTFLIISFTNVIEANLPFSTWTLKLSTIPEWCDLAILLHRCKFYHSLTQTHPTTLNNELHAVHS